MTSPTLPPLPEPTPMSMLASSSDREYTRAEVESIRIATLEWAAQQVPTSWLDSLLTGPEGMGPPPWNCPEVERLLSGIAAAIRAAIQESKHGDE